LIVRTGAMGDVLHAMPAVAAMRLQHPEWEIGWAIEPRWRPLLEGNCGASVTMPLVNRIHNVPTRAWNRRPFSMATMREIRDLRLELRAERYDLCVDMQGLLRSSVVGRLAAAGEFVGSSSPRELVARALYSRCVVLTAPHVIDRGCELLGGAIGEELRAARVLLPADQAALGWCDRLQAEVVPGGAGKKFVFMAPTAGWGAKQWPAEKFGAVAAALGRAGFVTLVNAVREDDPTAAAVVAASGGAAMPVCCTMPELMVLLSRAAVMIAGDTGPLHLAAALERPVVALFGPTDPARTGPYGTRSEVLRHASSRVDHRRHPVPEAGLAQITVEEVTAAALRLLACSPETQGDL
jgi:heptosyltransferase-1